MKILHILCVMFALAAWGGPADGQPPDASSEVVAEAIDTQGDPDSGAEVLSEKIDDVAAQVDENPAAQKARESIVGWIYEAAEYLSFPAFYWVAFAMMVAGLISFGLQLVLGKLVMLLQFHFSLTEILSDGLGFAVSAIGLILTTQAAAEKSGLVESPVLLLSATAAGLLFGLVFYIRGQTQEYREAREIRRRNKQS